MRKYCLIQTLPQTLFIVCSGMEQLIRAQKESIKELEAKILANLEEIKKVYRKAARFFVFKMLLCR